MLGKVSFQKWQLLTMKILKPRFSENIWICLMVAKLKRIFLTLDWIIGTSNGRIRHNIKRIKLLLSNVNILLFLKTNMHIIAYWHPDTSNCKQIWIGARIHFIFKLSTNSTLITWEVLQNLFSSKYVIAGINITLAKVVAASLIC